MAKNKGKDKDKKLKDLSAKDLAGRIENVTEKIQELKAQKKDADTKKEKQAIQAEIENAQERKQKITEISSNKAYAKPSAETLLDRIYKSDAFLSLSPANQQLVRETVDTYDVSQLQDINLSKKEINNLYLDARNAFKDEKKGKIKQLDQDYEEALRQDVVALEQGIAQQTAALELDETLSADQKAIAIRQLQDALDEAKSQYEVVAERKNVALQNRLEDLKVELDTSLGRAEEDKVIQLRQLERKLNTQLTDVQTNMAQRGLAFSGIRAKAESDLQDEYEDYMTTAELEAERKKADAERLAYEAERDARLYTTAELEDLVTTYTGQQKAAVQSAESVLGTDTTTGLLGSGAYDISPDTVPSYLIGGLTGSNTASQLAAQTTAGSNLNSFYANFERQYGTKALKAAFGDTAIGATTWYAGYTPVGQIKGTDTVATKRAKKDVKQYYTGQVQEAVQLGKDRLFLSKI